MHIGRTSASVGVAASLALVALCVGGASAESSCSGKPTTSPDGTVVRGSPCSDRIVVTSPKVREVFGGEGNDVIYANPDVEVVEGGEGDDTIYGELPETETGEEAAASRARPLGPRNRRSAHSPFRTLSLERRECHANEYCYGGDGSQELIGGAGNDIIFGQRGNDRLLGNEGNDQLFGGVGDESLISGGPGDDLLSGGLGTDVLDGNNGSDLVRGDGTTDEIKDTGSSGTDTLSFATAVTPGFHGSVGVAGFPADSNSEERGVYVRLDGTGCSGEYEACDNDARYGGGSDNVTVSGFENVIGSPFADLIVGSAGANRIDGGGGADAIYGGEGNDQLYGGADGDYLNGEGGEDTTIGGGGTNNCLAESTSECSGSAEAVTQRERSKISVGFIVESPPESLGYIGLYLTGSNSADHVTATYETGLIRFTTEGSSASFDTSAAARTKGCFTYEATKVECGVSKSLDAIVLAGMGGDDTITISGFPLTTTPVLLGGEGNDTLTSFGTEDMLVDGPGAYHDTLSSGSYDDALITNEGADTLDGGNGNDLLLSTTTCDTEVVEGVERGDILQGAAPGEGDGSAVNSASWAKYPVSEAEVGVYPDLQAGRAGNAAGPSCTGARKTATLANIDDLEGSTGRDELYGDAGENNLLGRLGEDGIWGREGNDHIEAADGFFDRVGGGPGADACTYDVGLDSVSSCP